MFEKEHRNSDVNKFAVYLLCALCFWGMTLNILVKAKSFPFYARFYLYKNSKSHYLKFYCLK